MSVATAAIAPWAARQLDRMLDGRVRELRDELRDELHDLGDWMLSDD